MLLPEQKEELKFMWDLGLPYKKIAEMLNVTVNVVAGICGREGWKRGGRPQPSSLLPAPKTFKKTGATRMYSKEKANVTGPKINIVDGGVTFMDLNPTHCKWPIDKFCDDGLMMYCGKARISDRTPYCQEHTIRAWAKR